MSRFSIAPSILAADFGRLAEEVVAAQEAGSDWLHVDVMDGCFVPNISLGPDIVAAISKVARVPVDVHLMIVEPDRHIPRFVDAGATAIGVHVEACPHLHRTLQLIKRAGVKATVVLNPATPAESIRMVMPDVDQVLVMTVNPGFGGQAFIRETLPKIAEIRRWIDESGRDIDLIVDGGIALDTVEDVARHGANVFVMGSAFFKSGDYKRFVNEVRAKLEPYEDGVPLNV